MTLYLIFHKVSGEPAFDVAEKTQIGNEEGWIIPTSGHRAYPVWSEELSKLTDGHVMPVIPDGWPDHYQEAERAVAKKGTGLNLMDFIKMPEPKINLRRRI
jgi:hypothetical protein